MFMPPGRTRTIAVSAAVLLAEHYLFHMPLLHMWAAFLRADQGWIAIALTLAVIALLGPPVERSKRWWRRTLDNIAGVLRLPGPAKSAALLD